MTFDTSSRPPALLTVLNGPRAGEELALEMEMTTIGRQGGSDLQLLGEGISRNHAVITREANGSYFFEDAGSRNGSFVNDLRVTGVHQLQDGDVIRVGVVALRFSSPAAEVDWTLSDTVTSNLAALFGRVSKAGSEGPALLVALSGAEAGKVHRLESPQATLGRDDTIDIQIQDAGISRRHAAINRVGETGYALDDLGSSNGTFVNQQRVEKPVLLRDGDMIQLGTMTVLRFVGISSPAALASGENGQERSHPPSRKPEATTTEIEERELEKELSLARKVQMAMVPPEGALFDTGAALFAGRVRSASFAAGDLWTHVETNSRLFLLVADVTGHGVGPAMITTVAKSCLDTVLLRAGEFSIEQVFDTMNRVILGISKQALVMTAFAVEIDPATQVLSFCSAGHIPQALVRRGEVTPLFTSQTSPLGQSLDSRFAVEKIPYQLDDWLVLYTDGLLEAESGDGAAYGHRRLHGFLRANHGLELLPLLDGIFTDVDAFSGKQGADDDVTVVVAKLKGRKRRQRRTTPVGY